jgi:hypothetical protein
MERAEDGMGQEKTPLTPLTPCEAIPFRASARREHRLVDGEQAVQVGTERVALQ